MDALKRRLIVISWLAANGDELFSARAHVPLIIERDAARKVALSRSLADVPPQNRVNLLGRRCSRRCERVFSRIEPPCNCPRRRSRTQPTGSWVPVLGWVEQIGESLPGEIGGQGHVLLSLTCVLPDRRRLTGPENGTVRLAA
jgi:hypothetical protein